MSVRYTMKHAYGIDYDNIGKRPYKSRHQSLGEGIIGCIGTIFLLIILIREIILF